MTNTPLNPDDEARLKRALEQTANGQVVSRGSFAQYAHTPLNRNLGGQNQNMGSQQRETRWLTPKPIVEALGVFDLDPCGAPGYSLAEETYQIDDGQDGLELPWHGRVWLNPPYGKLTAPFLGKLAEHGQGTALVFARTETRMFFDHVWPKATGILFMQGRVSFLDSNQVQAKANSGAPSVLIAYGAEDAKALRWSGLGRYVGLREELAA